MAFESGLLHEWGFWKQVDVFRTSHTTPSLTVRISQQILQELKSKNRVRAELANNSDTELYRVNNEECIFENVVHLTDSYKKRHSAVGKLRGKVQL